MSNSKMLAATRMIGINKNKFILVRLQAHSRKIIRQGLILRQNIQTAQDLLDIDRFHRI